MDVTGTRPCLVIGFGVPHSPQTKWSKSLILSPFKSSETKPHCLPYLSSVVYCYSIAFNVAHVSYYYQVLLLGSYPFFSCLLYCHTSGKTTQCEEIHKVEAGNFPNILHRVSGAMHDYRFGNGFYSLFFDTEKMGLLMWCFQWNCFTCLSLWKKLISHVFSCCLHRICHLVPWAATL